MNTSVIAVLVAVFLLCYIFMWTFIKPMKYVFRIFVNSIVGSVFLLIFNYIGANFNFIIGLNIYSALICGILGVPGFILLVILKLIGIYL